MSRLGRAWRELRRPDPETYGDLFEPFGLRGYRTIGELRDPLQRIAASLDKMERHKNRPRNVLCYHPELHDMQADSLPPIRERRGA